MKRKEKGKERKKGKKRKKERIKGKKGGTSGRKRSKVLTKRTTGAGK